MSILKEINLENLIRNNSGNIDWKSSIGKTIPFKYGDTVGILNIIGYQDGKVIISYNGKTKKMNSIHLHDLKIADLVGYRNYEYIYNVGDYVYSKNGDMAIVIDRDKINGERQYFLRCEKCGEEFWKTEYDIAVSKRGWCPVCCNETHIKVRKGFNDMWTTDPYLAEQLLDPEDGYKYVTGTNKKLRWKCKYCGEPYHVLAKPQTIVNLKRRVPCGSCGDGISFPNKFVYNLLKACGVRFKAEKVFQWSEGKRYDFYLIDFNIICEVNGMQHYDPSKFNFKHGSTRNDISNDYEKYKLAISNGISEENYIVIDARKSDGSYIMDSIMNSHLADVIDLSNIDYKDIELKSCGNIFDTIIDGINNGKSVKQMIQETNLADITIYRYIAKGEELGLIHYDREESNRIRLETLTKLNRQRCSKPILCVETGYAFMSSGILDDHSVEVFGERMVRSCVTDAINKNKKYKGYTWKYIGRDEFNELKSRYPDKVIGDFFIDTKNNMEDSNGSHSEAQ